MRVTRLSLTLGLSLLATAALALPALVKDFQSAYKIPKGSTLAKADCAVCHIGKSPKLNPFGADLKKVLEAEKTKKLTPELLKKVEALDSDKDGAKNIDEIKADTLPGDPKSAPKK